jgi:hypothetical protein
MLFSSCQKPLPKAIMLLLLGYAFTQVSVQGDEAAELKTQRTNSRARVVVDAKTQVISGLKTLPVTPVQHQAEFETIGKVINVAPLLALRERYLVTQAELNGAKARLKQAGQSLKRQQVLFRNGIAAKRSLQEQEAQGLTDQAIVEADRVKLMVIANEARLLWGKTLANEALSDKAVKLTAFLSGQLQLLQIILPANKQLAPQVETIFVEPTGYRAKARPASLIARSTQSDNTMQGESYFFQVRADNLRAGMKVSAWIPEPTLEQSGVIVPESALVWYMGQVYVYIKAEKDTFARRLVKEYSMVPEGYFIKEDIKVSEEVVIKGGQMLLSEELRGQIPDED